MGRLIGTKQAAAVLGVSLPRINQLINSPCPLCGKVEYHTDEDGFTEITHVFSENGCKRCKYTGQRLPTVGRKGTGLRAPHIIDEEDLELVRQRPPGYPEGRSRE